MSSVVYGQVITVTMETVSTTWHAGASNCKGLGDAEVSEWGAGESEERSAVAVLSNRWLIQLGSECLWLFKVNTSLVCILWYGPLCSSGPDHVFTITIRPMVALRVRAVGFSSCEKTLKIGRKHNIVIQWEQGLIYQATFASVTWGKHPEPFERAKLTLAVFWKAFTTSWPSFVYQGF